MSKPFEEITEAGFELLEEILEQPNTAPGDFFFDEPTADGQLELLINSKLVVLDDKTELSITELGRAALKHHDCIKEQDALIQKQRNEELEIFKSIANSSQELSKSAQEQASSAKELATSAKEQASSAKELASSAKEQASSASSLADTADKSSKSSTRYAKISAFLSTIAIIISIIAIIMQQLGT